MEDRFSAVEETDNLCFLCLQPASYLCPICSIPYCGTECFAVHQTKQGYCYPFRVLQKPGVSKLGQITGKQCKGMSYYQGYVTLVRECHFSKGKLIS